jgi:hypothetical protein
MTSNIIPLAIKPYVPRIITGREPATVIILPVVRIKRTPDDLPNPYLPRRKTLREMSSSICGND